MGQLKEAATCQIGSGARFRGVLHNRKRTRKRWGKFVASVVGSEELSSFRFEIWCACSFFFFSLSPSLSYSNGSKGGGAAEVGYDF